jgi:hypothetical protein
MEKLPSFHQMGGAGASTIYVYSDHQPNRQNIVSYVYQLSDQQSQKKRMQPLLSTNPQNQPAIYWALYFVPPDHLGPFEGFGMPFNLPGRNIYLKIWH